LGPNTKGRYEIHGLVRQIKRPTFMNAEEGDDTLSAGETGEATDASEAGADIIIGEIPAADDPTKMLWTARCTEATHDLLGHFDTRAEAEDAGARHLESDHRTP
jgi:hypothetical protein